MVEFKGQVIEDLTLWMRIKAKFSLVLSQPWYFLLHPHVLLISSIDDLMREPDFFYVETAVGAIGWYELYVVPSGKRAHIKFMATGVIGGGMDIESYAIERGAIKIEIKKLTTPGNEIIYGSTDKDFMLKEGDKIYMKISAFGLLGGTATEIFYELEDAYQ